MGIHSSNNSNNNNSNSNNHNNNNSNNSNSNNNNNSECAETKASFKKPLSVKERKKSEALNRAFDTFAFDDRGAPVPGLTPYLLTKSIQNVYAFRNITSASIESFRAIQVESNKRSRRNPNLHQDRSMHYRAEVRNLVGKVVRRDQTISTKNSPAGQQQVVLDVIKHHVHGPHGYLPQAKVGFAEVATGAKSVAASPALIASVLHTYTGIETSEIKQIHCV
jgi:hypothetical protein